MLPGLRTPRIVMQECVASITTATPFTSSSSISRLAIVLGHPLLHLRPVRDDFDDAGQLAQADDLAVRDVADVGHADERQQVVLAHAVEADVADEHHLVVLLGEELSQVDARVVVQAGRTARHTCGRRGPAFRAGLRDRDLRRRRPGFRARRARCAAVSTLRLVGCSFAVGQFAGQAAEVGAVGRLWCRLIGHSCSSVWQRQSLRRRR